MSPAGSEEDPAREANDSRKPNGEPQSGHSRSRGEVSGGIPDEPAGSPAFADRAPDTGEERPLAELPSVDFWTALYGRRSIRKFKPDPVPRELIDQVMHAGIWAPSSCNYQMWDLVAVDDPEVNERLTGLSLQMGNAPVNIVVSYGREFSEENWANIQSASALIQNMGLAAQVLGLGTFWITQTGGHERVRDLVGLPEDRLVVAVLALGYPKVLPKKGPKRRPLSQVTHYNHYAGKPIPADVDPERWDPELLATYQRARVLNGLRHNKPRAWEVRALTAALDTLVPKESPDSASPKGDGEMRWLDVLPCTGIVTERIARERRGYRFDVVERTLEVAEFVARRVKPAAGTFLWDPNDPAAAPPEAHYDIVSCLYRLEDLAAKERDELMRAMARWVKPGGKVLLGYVNKRSFHDWTERMRGRRGGPGGVEYVLAPDPNIGPFRTLSHGEVRALAEAAGLTQRKTFGAQAVPQTEEIEFRARNFSPRGQGVARLAGKLMSALEHLPGAQSRLGRFQFCLFERP